jgi:hypothetical protein
LYQVRLLILLELLFDLGKGSFQGGAPDRTRRALVQNAFPLQLKRLASPLFPGLRGGRVLLGVARALTCGKTLRNLVLDGFAFPTSCHTSMLMRNRSIRALFTSQ